jgi:RNA polymerase sigma factor (sigma-70 family)
MSFRVVGRNAEGPWAGPPFAPIRSFTSDIAGESLTWNPGPANRCKGARFPRVLLYVTAAVFADGWLLPTHHARGFSIFWPVVAQPWDLDTEQELAVRARGGDKKALGILLTRFGPVLFRSVLLPRLGNAGAAEQALGDTYARVVERIGQFEWQGTGFYPWLRMVALRVALDLLRKRRREVLFQPEDLQREVEDAEGGGAEGDISAEVIERSDLEAARRKVAAALSELNPRYAKAIRLRVLEERPREEVARELGVSTATFDVILHRAMTALRKAVASIDESVTEP